MDCPDTFWVLRGGYGTDGGFGDYAPPYWEDKCVTVDEHLLWFETKEEADKACEALNEREWQEAQKAGYGGDWSGDFPYEYRSFEAKLLDTVSWTDDDNYSKLLEKIVVKEYPEYD